MSPQILQVVWNPADTRDVFERAATFAASQAASEVVVDESGLVIR